jgi:hypothetical protein
MGGYISDLIYSHLNVLSGTAGPFGNPTGKKVGMRNESGLA